MEKERLLFSHFERHPYPPPALCSLLPFTQSVPSPYLTMVVAGLLSWWTGLVVLPPLMRCLGLVSQLVTTC